MPKGSTTKSAKKRVSVKEIPSVKKKMTGKELKKVMGGKWEGPDFDAAKNPKPDGLPLKTK